ncbi:MAG: trimeric intracellular cation channel family protein [Woeseia sp.]|nr:trimeric intracellular cation channel family protein [Woeseia sp.]NNE62016.1 trimeric intracellular cation channel family protein [Woeseia sp.]
MSLEPLFILEMVGTAVFAISGALAASRANMDLFGFSVLALMPAIGGGTLRDIVLGRTPVFWIENTSYVAVALLAALGVYFFADRPGFRRTLLVWMDAVGLALFAVLGTEIALNTGVSMLIAVMMGVITAVLGGMIRDIICNEIPLVLTGEIYATAAFVASIAYIAAIELGANTTLSLVIGVVAGFAVRGAGIVFHLSLPRVGYREDD